MTEHFKTTLASLIRCRYRLADRLGGIDSNHPEADPTHAALSGLMGEVDSDIRRAEEALKAAFERRRSLSLA